MLFEWVNKWKLTFEQGFEARYIYLLSQIVSLALFSKWENWGSEQLNDLLDVSQWVSRGVRNQGLWIPKSRLCYAFVHSFHKELMRDHSLPGLLLHFFPPFPHAAKTAKTTLSANSLPILYIHLPGTSSWNPDWAQWCGSLLAWSTHRDSGVGVVGIAICKDLQSRPRLTDYVLEFHGTDENSVQ